MRPLPFLFALLGLVFFSSSCEKGEEAGGSSGVDITFRTDSGYTYANDTVGLSDTLRIGVIVDDGSDPLVRFYLGVSYDSTAEVGMDTVLIDAEPFHYEAEVITRSQAGTEQWIFTVEEPDGDLTRRRLTFVVQ